MIDGIFVEGVGDALGIEVTAYSDLRELSAPNVTYVIAQEPAQAALKASYAVRAAVGTALGSVGVRKVHEDIGSVDIEDKPRDRRGEENYSLTDELLGRWLSAALCDGKTFKSLTPAQQSSLTAKGYMYVARLPITADFTGTVVRLP
ncbi:DUF2586 family protein [Marinilabilia salmonicolor]|uniref:DUF2586 family protein n=1 Tax=Marinilabilia salmonicolor TaxID=989 RepID=UPI0006870BBB